MSQRDSLPDQSARIGSQGPAARSSTAIRERIERNRNAHNQALLAALHRIAFPGPYEGSAEWARGVAWRAVHSRAPDEKGKTRND